MTTTVNGTATGIATGTATGRETGIETETDIETTDTVTIGEGRRIATNEGMIGVAQGPATDGSTVLLDLNQ